MTEASKVKQQDDDPEQPPKEQGNVEEPASQAATTAASESEPPQPDDDTTPFDDAKTDEAIADIVATESDELLEAEDAAVSRQAAQPKRGFWGRLLRSKWTRRLVLLIILGGVGAVCGLPTARYWVLNTAGVQSSASVTVVDGTTQMPLQGVQVAIGPRKIATNKDGQATLSQLKLGPTSLVISQVGFAQVRQKITVGWGSNPLGTIALNAVGIQYTIEVHDYLSDQPLEGVQASSGVASAISDRTGKITLTLEDAQAAKEAVTLAKGGYRTEQITLAADPKAATKVTMVLARKAVFVTKQSGKFDVYKSDLDGQNRQVLLPGTGAETSNLALAVSPDGTRAALVSTRDNKREADGTLLSGLSLIDVANGEVMTVAYAPQIKLIDWLGPRLIFQQVSADTTAANRHQVIAYNYTDNTRLQLAAAKSLNAVLSAQGAIYYAVDSDESNPAVKPGLFTIKPDGSGKHAVLDAEVWAVLRTDYNTLSVQTPDQWYSYTLSSGASAKIGAPATVASRLYIDNSDRSKSLWISGGTLKLYEPAAAKDTDVQTTQTGLAYPVQWLSDSAALYRLASSGQTADYAVSLLGGAPRKVSDVSASFGFALP